MLSLCGDLVVWCATLFCGLMVLRCVVWYAVIWCVPNAVWCGVMFYALWCAEQCGVPCNLEVCCGGLVRWYGMGKVVWCDVVKCVSGLMWYGGVVCCDLVCGCLILLFG